MSEASPFQQKRTSAFSSISLSAFSFFLCTLFLAFPCSSFAEPIIVPTPQKIALNKGTLPITKGTRILYQTRDVPRTIESTLQPLAQVFAGEIELITGHLPKVLEQNKTNKPRKGDILLRFSELKKDFAKDETEEVHSYQLNVEATGAIIEAPYYKGVAHGTATFLQLIKDDNGASVVTAAKISDAPEAAYRSVMLDVARQVHSIGVIKDVIRLARLYRLRYVHLHLTDDQNFTFPFDPVTKNLRGNFAYKREQLVDLVAYADARGITLIPELDLPGHSSKLRASGYLNPTRNDADVADPANTAKITAIIDEMLSVFKSSPYFHIGGDESGAGRKLIPFLKAINGHLRSKPEGEKKRLIVWEGFHGAPTRDLPATGNDRIIVMAWESSYNAPWNLLKSKYQIINSSWKPTYLAGGGAPTRPGNTGGRKFKFEDLYRWSKNRFMHWEPGRPIYHDAGPRDKNKDDGEWDASWIGKESQILGGQMQFWEQSENAVIERLQIRLAIAAQRLWAPSNKLPFEDFMKKLDVAHERVMTIVQPIAVVYPPIEIPNHPITDIYYPYQGDSIELTLRNRSKIPGTIHFNEGRFTNQLGYIGFRATSPPTTSSPSYTAPLKKSGGFSIRAALFRKDGSEVEGHTWAHLNNWPNRVHMRDYDIGRKPLRKVVDLASLPESKIKRSYNMPMVRGPLQHIEIVGQMLTGNLTVPEDGEYEIAMKTQHGTASLYLDLDQDGDWDRNESLIQNTPNSEKPLAKKVTLKKGQKYLLRVDHMTGMARPVLVVYLQGPNIPKRVDITPYLSLPDSE